MMRFDPNRNILVSFWLDLAQSPSFTLKGLGDHFGGQAGHVEP
jgi:hypothetical protein